MATYLDTYPSSISSGAGLIATLSTLDNIPWNVLNADAIQDIERLYGIRSGFKTITAGFLAADTQSRAKILSTLFAQKWTKLWNDFSLEYDPLSAYIVDESGSRTKEGSRNSVNKYGKIIDDTGTDSVKSTGTDSRTETYGKVTDETGTDTGTVNKSKSNETLYGKTVNESSSETGTVSTEGSDNNTSTSGLWGFNSSTAVNSDTSNDTGTNTSTETRNLSNTHNTTNAGKDNATEEDNETRNLTKEVKTTNSGQDEEQASSEATRDTTISHKTSQSGQDSNDITDNETEDYSVLKKGNIGYATPQKLLREDIALWETPFFNIVFDDIDSFITIMVY